MCLFLLHKTDILSQEADSIIIINSIIFTNPTYCIKFLLPAPPPPSLMLATQPTKTLVRNSNKKKNQEALMDSRRQFQNTGTIYKGKTTTAF